MSSRDPAPPGGSADGADGDDGATRDQRRQAESGDPQADEERWDADDPRRVRDQMAPPREPCECYCLHCERVFMSDAIWFQRVIGDPDGFDGFWMCPTPNCSGAGFTFDIFPTDPDHPANEGWHYDDDDEEEDGEGAGDEEGEFDESEFAEGEAGEGDETAAEWDPDESKWKALDEELGDPDDDDVEGDEWKH